MVGRTMLLSCCASSGTQNGNKTYHQSCPIVRSACNKHRQAASADLLCCTGGQRICPLLDHLVLGFCRAHPLTTMLALPLPSPSLALPFSWLGESASRLWNCGESHRLPDYLAQWWAGPCCHLVVHPLAFLRLQKEVSKSEQLKRRKKTQQKVFHPFGDRSFAIEDHVPLGLDFLVYVMARLQCWDSPQMFWLQYQ